MNIYDLCDSAIYKCRGAIYKCRGAIYKPVRVIRFISAYAIANLQAALEYRAAFIAQIGTMAINDSLWLFFWWNYFHQFPLTHGWQATDIVILWSITACGFGISAGLFGNVRQLVTLIMNGGLDAYLSMPRNALLHVCIAMTDPTAWGDILFAVGAYLLLVHPDLSHIALFFLLAWLVSFIFTAFIVTICSLAFFLGNTEGLALQMANALVSFSTYPMSIFNGAVRVLLFTIIPAGFVSFIPLQLLHKFTWPLLGVMVGATTLMVLAAIGLFEVGRRRYESGNLLGMQG